VLERLLPAVVACAETREDLLETELFAVERTSLGRAVPKRRREFATGRACARRALGQLGAPVVGIAAGARGEPRWPSGVVGSITHCDGLRAAAVAWSSAVAGVGIDAEPDAPLPDGVLDEVAHGGELELVAGGPAAGVDVGRLLFSAKEAIYKAWYPLTERWLGFEDVELSLDLAAGTFCAALLVDGPVVGGAELRELRGRWTVEDGVIGTAVVVPAAMGPVGPALERRRPAAAR
jgi:4'-phosphopantetheinyl transferase EntD